MNIEDLHLWRHLNSLHTFFASIETPRAKNFDIVIYYYDKISYKILPYTY